MVIVLLIGYLPRLLFLCYVVGNVNSGYAGGCKVSSKTNTGLDVEGTGSVTSGTPESVSLSISIILVLI